jgi:hypothetical protein
MEPFWRRETRLRASIHPIVQDNLLMFAPKTKSSVL